MNRSRLIRIVGFTLCFFIAINYAITFFEAYGDEEKTIILRVNRYGEAGIEFIITVAVIVLGTVGLLEEIYGGLNER